VLLRRLVISIRGGRRGGRPTRMVGHQVRAEKDNANLPPQACFGKLERNSQPYTIGLNTLKACDLRGALPVQ
jgi:hypothetical protein